MHYDAIIIGAGMSGLAAGIRLAMYNKKVCIFERHNALGGLNSFYSIDRRKFDVGLHAITNFVPKNTKGAPLTKLLRQLRINYDDLHLREQNYSEICFKQAQIKFSNDFQTLIGEIAGKFPSEIDGFQKLTSFIKNYDNLSLNQLETRTAREFLPNFIKSTLLIDMLLCPLTYYGSAIENDMVLDQFVTMFKSLFLEGFSRPEEGVRRIIYLLRNRYRETGGQIQFLNGIKQLNSKKDSIYEIITDKEEAYTADLVLSSAGYVETMRLINDKKKLESSSVGQMSFAESICCLDEQPRNLGYSSTITFFNTSEKYLYEKPQHFLDVKSGVICCPNNYQLQNEPSEGMIRITNIANYQRWKDLYLSDKESYCQAKEIWFQKSLESICSFKPDFRKHIIFKDIFTPHTIEHYTGHINGAVYGSPVKRKTGDTAFENLKIIGTDQGFLGIVGALLSGISMANLHGLTEKE